MKFGLGRLRLPPDAFWRMTMRELDAASQGMAEHYGGAQPPPMDRERLLEMMQQYPDTPPR